MKLFNFTLGGNAITPNIKEESVILRQFGCVLCVCKTIGVCVCFYFYLKKKKNLKQYVKKKNQPKKITH